jgi:hypothetical protein
MGVTHFYKIKAVEFLYDGAHQKTVVELPNADLLLLNQERQEIRYAVP